MITTEQMERYNKVTGPKGFSGNKFHIIMEAMVEESKRAHREVMEEYADEPV